LLQQSKSPDAAQSDAAPEPLGDGPQPTATDHTVPNVKLDPPPPAPAPPSRRGRLALVLTGGVGLAGLVAGAVLLGRPPAATAPPEAPPLASPTPVPKPVPTEPPPPVALVEARGEPVQAPAPGRLRLVGVPPRARVTVDGALLARPGGETAFPPGPHKVVVEARGYVKFEQTVELSAGEAVEVKVVLKKARKRR
jgi:PEGA domain